MKIQQFDGGLSTRLAPHFLQTNEGVKYKNVDNEPGTLTPVKTKLATATASDKFAQYYVAEAEWVSSATIRDYVEFKDNLYWADRVGRPQKYDGTDQNNLGIAPPDSLTASAVVGPDPVTKVSNSITQNTEPAGTPAYETNYYKLANRDGVTISSIAQVTVTSRGGSFTAPYIDPRDVFGPIADDGRFEEPIFEQDPNDGAYRTITLKNPSGITITDGVEVYRLYNNKYYLVGTLTSNTDSVVDNVEDISGNTELDETELSSLSGVYQYVVTYYNSADGSESGPSPLTDEIELNTGGSMLLTLPVSSDPQVDRKRIYRVGGNITTLSLVEEVDNADLGYVDILNDTQIDGSVLTTSGVNAAPEGLQFLTEAYAMLFGALGSKLYFTPIGQPDQWPDLFFLDFDIDITGLAAVANGILVFTRFKTFIVTGTGPSSLSQQSLGGDQGCIAHESVQLHMGTAIWVSEDGICVSAGNDPEVVTQSKLGKLDLDVVNSTLFNQVYYLHLVDGTTLAFDNRYATIFKQLELGIESVAKGEGRLYGIANGVLNELFKGEGVEAFEYLSPRFVEGSLSEDKTYKKVFIYSKGDIIINIIINDQVVATKSLTGENGFQLQIPTQSQRGHFIQFGISGTGEVYEIEYEAGRRQNG